MAQDTERWVDVEEVADYLGVKPDTVRSWVKSKSMPARKIGRRWKFKISEIDDWIKSGKSAIDC